MFVFGQELLVSDHICLFFAEEVLGSDHALWWSKDLTYIVYAQFNDTVVRKYSYPYYGDPSDEYGKIKKIAYPKVCVIICS